MPLDFKGFVPTGYCLGLKGLAVNSLNALKMNPTLHNLALSKYQSEKYLMVYFEELQLWIEKETA